MYKKLSLPYSTMHELATHTHTYAHIIILLTCGCNFLEVRVSRAVHRARGGPICPMLSDITCTARPTPSLTNRPQSEDVTPTAMICVPTAMIRVIQVAKQKTSNHANGSSHGKIAYHANGNDAHHANGYDLNPKKQIH